MNPDDYLHPWTPDLTISTPAPAEAARGNGGAAGQPDANMLNQITKRQRN